MDSFALLLMLLLAFFGSTIDSSARRTTLNAPDSYKTTYDVTKFGAIGDGEADDSDAFESAWKAACQNGTVDGIKITVPSGKTFLLSPVEFEGPCKSPLITFEILGNIVAPPKAAWKKKEANQWLYFHKIDGLTVTGNEQGLIDGRGDTWWKQGDEDKSRPTALRFYLCNKLQVRGLKHRNSQKNQVSINKCNGATISNLDINAPANSPNTDGIDISSSTDVRVQDCLIATGDDCIAINPGTSNVLASNITCGPGHGISIGSLGINGQHDQVEAIIITNSTFIRTDNGVRIKTWQGGSGFARNITFSNITFVEANNPVIIDQYYCPHMICEEKTSAVEISHVRFSGLRGTSICKNSTINFSCSRTVPCTDIILDDVDIESDDPHDPTSAHCINAHGVAHTSKPIVNCLVR